MSLPWFLVHADPAQTVARRAYQAVWERRSPHNLLGNTLGAQHGQWLAPGMSGIQAGMDSYFEYALKGAILLSERGQTILAMRQKNFR